MFNSACLHSSIPQSPQAINLYCPTATTWLGECIFKDFPYQSVIAPPAELDTLKMLTPGDFLVVDRRRSVLGVNSAKELLSLLKKEYSFKPDPARPIGFVT